MAIKTELVDVGGDGAKVINSKFHVFSKYRQN